MTIRLISTFGIRALLGFALLGVFSLGILAEPTTAQTTTITFNDAAAGNNSDIARDYGSFISGNSTGFVTSGGATPNIGLSWLGNIANEWEYHTATTWTHESPVHVAQLDHNRDSPYDDNAEIVFSPIDGRSVTINSFRLSGATNMSGTATYDWEVLGTGLSGTHSISPGNNTGIVNVGFIGLPGDSHTLRFTRHADGGDSAFGTALDDLSFSESLAAGAEVLRLTVNRATGNITLKNVGSNAADIIGYSITSDAGALNSSSWTTVKNHYDKNGNGSFDSNDAWTAFPQGDPGSELTEFQFGGDGGTLAPNASLNLGNSWSQSPTEDLKLEVVLSDNRINSYSVEYTGGPSGGFAVGDLNFDGTINAADWPIYNAGRGVDLSSVSSAAAYGMGDLDGDLDNDIADFVLFKTLFTASQGATAWAALGTVPEPTSGVLLLTALALIPGMRPRRGTQGSRTPDQRKHSRRRHTMKFQSLVIVCSFVCFSLFAGQTNATILTFEDNPGDNKDLLKDHGSFISSTSVGFDTSNGTTPDIGLTWAPGDDDASNNILGDNVLEYHSSAVWNTAPLSPSVLQFDLDGSVQPGGVIPPNPTIDFSVAAGKALVIHGFDIGLSDNAGSNTTDWTINVVRLSDLATVFTTTTGSIGAAQAQSVPINFTGDLGVDYQIQFDDNGSNNVNGAIDNFSFGQTTVGAVTMNLFVNTVTGELTLENNSGSAFTIDSYEISSFSSSLDPAGWNSLQDQDYEGNGNGNIGSGNGWEEAGGVDSGQLIESYLLSDTTIANGASISLGNGFDFNKLGAQGDLTFGFHETGTNTFLTTGTVEYSSEIPVLDADFDDDNDVDGQDFLAWQQGFGTSGATNAQGDANGDGNVNAQDLTAWQALYGASAATSAVTTVPEPSTVSLFGLALLGLTFLLSRQNKKYYGDPVMIRSSSIRCSSSQVGRIVAVAVLFLVTAPAMADKTTDRQYDFGDGGSSTTSDSQFVNSNDRQNLTIGASPTYVNVNSGQFVRPGTSSGDKGARFDGNNDHLWGDPLNRPDETAGDQGIGPILSGFPLNYDTITARGMQMWVYPEASAIGNGRQGIVFDTIAAGGVSITADGKWTQVNDSVVVDGVIEATVPVIGDQWYHVMHHVYPSAHLGAPKLASGFLFEKGFTSVVYVDGIAVSVNNGNPAPNELDNGSRVGVLAIGAEELPGDAFDPVFGNFFKGAVDNLEMYVFGDNSSLPAGQDYGTFSLFSDNDWITDQIAAIPGGSLSVGDINRNGSVDSGDVAALVNNWRREKRLKGSSVEVNVGDWETWGWGDLNTDGLVDLYDAILLNDALLAAGQGALNFDLLVGVPEPTSLLLAVLCGTTLCLTSRPRRSC